MGTLTKRRTECRYCGRASAEGVRAVGRYVCFAEKQCVRRASEER